MNYHAWLAHFPKITYKRYSALKTYFSDFKNLYDTELDELLKAGLEENIASEFLTWRDKNPIEKILENLINENIIAAGGALISEYPPNFQPTQYSFPARNRIVAGLSLGTLVIEAPIKSGALITARCALDYNREVMAVPHATTSPTGAGPNNLIKFGAKLITEPNDILEALNLQTVKQISPTKEFVGDNNTEIKILKILTKEPKNINQIILESQLDIPTANSTLILMEIKGSIKNLGGMNYIKK